jgi:hypothetical protein
MRLGTELVEEITMKNCSFSLVLAGGLLALIAAPCAAQPPGVAGPGLTQPSFISRPTISPYLLLNRGGAGSVALNYYTLVRPQNQFYQSLQQLQQEVGANTQDLSALQRPAVGLGPTGHAFGFQTQASYFMTMGRGQVGQIGRPGQAQQGMSGIGGTGGYGGRGGVGASFGQGAAGMTGAQPNTMGRTR